MSGELVVQDRSGSGMSGRYDLFAVVLCTLYCVVGLKAYSCRCFGFGYGGSHAVGRIAYGADEVGNERVVGSRMIWAGGKLQCDRLLLAKSLMCQRQFIAVDLSACQHDVGGAPAAVADHVHGQCRKASCVGGEIDGLRQRGVGVAGVCTAAEAALPQISVDGLLSCFVRQRIKIVGPESSSGIQVDGRERTV